MKEAVSRKKEAHKAMCQNSTDGNKRRCKSMKNKASKAVSKAMREMAEEAITELHHCQYGMFRQVKGLKTDSKQVQGGRCVRGSDGKQCFSENERSKVWKDYMERIMNEEDDWDCNVEGDAVEGPVVCVCRGEVLQALNEMKTGRAHGHSEVSLELIIASGGIGIHVIAEVCQKVLNGFGMPPEWVLGIVVPIFKGKGDIRNCSCY